MNVFFDFKGSKLLIIISCLVASFLFLRKLFLVRAKSFRAFSHSSLSQFDFPFFGVGDSHVRDFTVLPNTCIDVSARNELKVVILSFIETSLLSFVNNNSNTTLSFFPLNL